MSDPSCHGLMPRIDRPAAQLAILALVCCLVAACGSERGGKSTQVVATVNGDEITVHQVNMILQRIPNADPANVEKVRDEVTQRLVDSALLRQQAVAAKLDRNPDVLQAIEASRNEILASSYLQGIVARVQPPDDADVSTFYQKYIDMFTQRKVFRLVELILPTRPPFMDELKNYLDRAKSADEVKVWLKSRGVESSQAITVRSTDQFPLEAVASIVKVKAGDFLFLPSQAGLSISYVETATPAALNEATAKPLIQNYLLQQRRNETGRAEVERLRASAKIERIGSPATAEQPKTEVPSPAPKGGDVIERGVKGMK